jgi:hypothetical protein
MMKLKAIMLLIVIVHPATLVAQQKDEKVRVRGRVTDLLGYTLEGATLKFFSRTWYSTPTELRLVKSTNTDANGNYSLDELAYGYYLVTTELSGFRYTEASRVYLGKGDNLLDIGLEVGVNWDVPPIEIKGTVRQTDKAPVKDVTVTLMSAFNPGIVHRTRTDENGKYKFVVYTRSQYLIYAGKAGFEISASTTQGGDKENDFILFPLRKQ